MSTSGASISLLSDVFPTAWMNLSSWQKAVIPKKRSSKANASCFNLYNSTFHPTARLTVGWEESVKLMNTISKRELCRNSWWRFAFWIIASSELNLVWWLLLLCIQHVECWEAIGWVLLGSLPNFILTLECSGRRIHFLFWLYWSSTQYGSTIHHWRSEPTPFRRTFSLQEVFYKEVLESFHFRSRLGKTAGLKSHRERKGTYYHFFFVHLYTLRRGEIPQMQEGQGSGLLLCLLTYALLYILYFTPCYVHSHFRYCIFSAYDPETGNEKDLSQT